MVALRRFQGGDGFPGLFAKIAKANRGAHADVTVPIFEHAAQRRDDLFRIVFSQCQETDRDEPVALLLGLQIRK